MWRWIIQGCHFSGFNRISGFFFVGYVVGKLPYRIPFLGYFHEYLILVTPVNVYSMFPKDTLMISRGHCTSLVGPWHSQGALCYLQGGPLVSSREPSSIIKGPSGIVKGPSSIVKGPSGLVKGPLVSSRGPLIFSRGPLLSSGPYDIVKGTLC